MKKFIIPLTAVVVAGAAAVSLIVTNANKSAVADKPKPPEELPSGNYYIEGDPANDNLYLVVENGTIRFQSDTGDLRDAFKASDINLDEKYLVDAEALERQVNLSMANWGDTYNYVLGKFGDSTDKFMVYTKAELDEHGEPQGGQGFMYSIDTKSLHSVRGDFILAEES